MAVLDPRHRVVTVTAHDRQRVDAPAFEWFALEPTRATAEFCALAVSWPLLGLARPGDGHPVMVLPGFGTTDLATQSSRWVLRQLGYRVHGWRLGRNVGPTPEVFDGIQRRLLELHGRYGEKVSVVGQSLGGVYARYLARHHPDAVRQVITLAAPYRLRPGDRSSLSALSDWGPSELQMPLRLPDSHIAEEDRPPLTVPATSIYTRTDGIVRWQLCIETVGPLRENIEVPGSHSGLIHHPAALIAIADRLAQPEGRWVAFHPPAGTAHLFPAPVSWRPPAAR
jgi:hypothetical protein